MSYRVQTPQFSGPFDLLLQLVYKQKIMVSELGIADIASQYIQEIQKLDGIDLDVASDFVLVAATLLALKAQKILPVDNEDEQGTLEDIEEISVDDARELLVERLFVYKQFLDISRWLKNKLCEEEKYVASRVCIDEDEFQYMPNFLEGISLRTLGVICADLLSQRDELLLDAHHIAQKRKPIALTCAYIDRITRKKFKMSFSELLREAFTKEELVSNFMAMLELVAQGYLEISQKEMFGDITMIRTPETRTRSYEPHILEQEETLDTTSTLSQTIPSSNKGEHS